MFSYLLSVGAQANSSGSGVTSPVDTSTANFLVASVASAPSAPFVLSDSYGNTWVPLTAYVQTNVQVQLYWCALPTVGVGHTFQALGVNTFASLCVAAFSGFAGSSGPENGATGTASPLSPGSVTPGADNSLAVYALGSSFSSGATVDIGTVVQQLYFAPGDSYAGALAYNIQTTAMAIAPTFTFSPAYPYAASSIAIFSPAVHTRASSAFFPLFRK